MHKIRRRDFLRTGVGTPFPALSRWFRAWRPIISVAVFVPDSRRTMKHGGHSYLARFGVKHIFDMAKKMWIICSNDVFCEISNARKKRKLFAEAGR